MSKLGPLEFATHGVSLGGCAKAPMFYKESCEAGVGAAMKASIPMKKGYIETEGIVADIDLTACNQCGLCSKRCPYNAIRVDAEDNPAVIKALCKAAGLCAADCPKECISIVHYNRCAGPGPGGTRLGGERRAEDHRLRLPLVRAGRGGQWPGSAGCSTTPNARLIRVMCSARVLDQK